MCEHTRQRYSVRFVLDSDCHVYLGCLAEAVCADCGHKIDHAELWGIDCMDDDLALTEIRLDRSNRPDQVMRLKGFLGDTARDLLFEIMPTDAPRYTVDKENDLGRCIMQVGKYYVWEWSNTSSIKGDGPYTLHANPGGLIDAYDQCPDLDKLRIELIAKVLSDA